MKTKQRNWMLWVFVLVVFAYVQWAVLSTVATFYYPGGTIPNHDTVGYSFWSNTFSDMGRRVSLSGEPNTVSRVIWETSMYIYELILCLFFAVLPRLFSKAKSARRLATIGSIFGITAMVLLFIATSAPMDLHESIHNTASLVSYGAIGVALILYSIAIFRNESFPKTYAYVLVAYIIILVAGGVIGIISIPNWETEWGNMLISTYEHIQGYIELIFIPIVAYGAWRVDKRLRDLGPESMLGKD